MINEVYNTVQEQLNKNGRGILSPARFNLFIETTQLNVLDNLIHQYRRSKLRDTRYVRDASLQVLEDVLDTFTKTDTLTRYIGGSIQDYHSLPDDYMAFGSASVDDVEIEKIPSHQKSAINRNRYLKPTADEPVCYVEGNKMYVLPTTIGRITDAATIDEDPYIDEVDLVYYRTPAKPNWTYTLVSGKAIFNQSDSEYQDIELPYAFMGQLVNGVLSQAGLHIRDDFAVQSALSEDKNDFNKDNQ